MKTKSSHSRMIMLGVMLAIGAAVTSGIIQNHNNILETNAASTLHKSFNFLDGGSSANSAYASVNLDTNVSYASDNPDGTSGTTAWQADYANLSLTTGTRLGGKLVSTVQTDDSTAWANIRTKFTFTPAIEKVEILGVTTFGTAANVTNLYLQSSSNGTTWSTVSTIASISSTVTFDSMSISASSYLRFGIALTASSTNSGVAFTGIKVYSTTVTKTLSSIAVTTQPTDKSYLAGESFDPTGMVITATYSDSSSANVTSSCTYTPNPLTAGTTSVTASYTEGSVTKTASITGITVTARTLVSISVLTNPTKMTYKVGQAFSPTGMKIRATFNAGATNDDYTAYSYSPTAAFDSLGSKTITITSTENASISTTLNVTVVDVAEGTYGITSGATVYQATMDPASLVIDKSDSLLSDLSFSAISNIRLYGSPITASIMMGSGSAVGGSFVIAVESGLVISKIEFVDNDKDSGAAGTMTLSVNTESVLFSAINTEDSIIFKPYTNSITIATTARLWTAQIILTAHKLTTAAVDYGTHFLASTAAECSAQSVTTATWNKLKATYVSADASVKSLIKAADADPSGDDLEEAIARYTSIVSKYAYEDYLDLGIIPHSNHISNDSQSNNAIIYVVVISFVGITVLVASRLMRKKNEEVA